MASEGNIKKKKGRKRKIILVLSTILLAALALFIYIRYYYVFGEGVKSGQLNFIVRKGYIFKSYEGRMIQVGYKSNNGGIQSNEFEFSVEDERIAKQLELQSGNIIDVRYKEYFGTLPWRGMSRYVVDSIVAIRDLMHEDAPPPSISLP